MTRHSFVLAAAAALLVGQAAHASQPPREVQAYLQHASAVAAAKLETSGVALPADGVAIGARVASDGRLMGLHVVRSSGSLETDERAVAALRRFYAGEPPVFITGAEVTLALTPRAMLQAKVP